MFVICKLQFDYYFFLEDIPCTKVRQCVPLRACEGACVRACVLLGVPIGGLLSVYED